MLCSLLNEPGVRVLFTLPIKGCCSEKESSIGFDLGPTVCYSLFSKATQSCNTIKASPSHSTEQRWSLESRAWCRSWNYSRLAYSRREQKKNCRARPSGDWLVFYRRQQREYWTVYTELLLIIVRTRHELCGLRLERNSSCRGKALSFEVNGLQTLSRLTFFVVFGTNSI